MQFPPAGRRLIALMAAITAGSVLAAAQTVAPARARVAVVALRDSGLLTLCPVLGKTVVASNVASSDMKAEASVSYPPDGSQSIGLKIPDGLTRLALPKPGAFVVDGGGGDAAAAAASTAVTLERLALDPEAAWRAAARFQELGKFVVVPSVDQADLVFLIESRYVPLATSVTQLPAAPRGGSAADGTGPSRSDPARIFADAEREWRRRSWADRRDPPDGWPPRPDDPAASAGSYVVTGVRGGDRFPTWRESAIAIAVPAGVYRQHAGDGAALTAARTWQGVAGVRSIRRRWDDLSAAERNALNYRNLTTEQRERGPGGFTIRAASPEDIVDQFHGKAERMPKDLPACAATGGVIRDVADRGAATGAPGAPATGTDGAVVAAPATRSAAPRFLSNITLVTVPVTVTDADGRIVPDLPPSAFHLYEDDVEQRLDRVESGAEATRVALLIDTSQGMRAAIDGMRTAAASLVAALRPSDPATVVAFDNRVRALTPWSVNREAALNAIGALRQRGQTRIYDALALALLDRLGSGDARQALVLFSDGVDTASQLTDAEGALAAVDISNVGVYVVRYDTSGTTAAPPASADSPLRRGVALDETHTSAEARREADRFLERLAEESGGRLYAARADANPQQLMAQVSRDLSQQYVLRYYPARTTLDGLYRQIRVTVDRPGLTVRARSGYRAGALPTSPDAPAVTPPGTIR